MPKAAQEISGTTGNVPATTSKYCRSFRRFDSGCLLAITVIAKGELDLRKRKAADCRSVLLKQKRWTHGDFHFCAIKSEATPKARSHGGKLKLCSSPVLKCKFPTLILVLNTDCFEPESHLSRAVYALNLLTYLSELSISLQWPKAILSKYSWQNEGHTKM